MPATDLNGCGAAEEFGDATAAKAYRQTKAGKLWMRDIRPDQANLNKSILPWINMTVN